MMIETVLLLTFLGTIDGRVVELCSEILQEYVVSNSNNVVCVDATDQTLFQLNILSNSKVFLVPYHHVSLDKAQLCEISSQHRDWVCQSVIFLDQNDVSLEREKRQSDAPPQPRLPLQNISYSVMTVAGVDWVCQMVSETQCKPLYPKQPTNKAEETSQQGVVSSRQQGPRAQYLTDERLDSVSGLVDDGDRWRWGEEGSRGRSNDRSQDRQQNVFQPDNEHLNNTDSNDGEQFVYNINGITWLCRQFAQLQCYPIMNPWDGSTPPPGLVPPHVDPGVDNGDHESTGGQYPDTQARILARDNTWEYQERSKPKRTTFCSRCVKFTAKDEAVLSFNTFSGNMRLYLWSVRRRGMVEIRARMLRPGEDGLGTGVVNEPVVVLVASVTCDSISVGVEGRVYQLDYGWGRLGVRDLEVLGKLESTGMVPRGKVTQQQRPGSVRNFIEENDWSEIQLRDSPVDTQEEEYDDDNIVGVEGDTTSIVDDTYLIKGQGNVEVSLGEKRSQSEHRYQISKGEDGEVKVEVINVGETKDDNIVIDNRDYNYTLIISGQNIQVIHHDTNRNLTYKHGLREEDVSGVGVSGDLSGSTTTFKQPNHEYDITDEDTMEETVESPRSFPSSLPSSSKPDKVVSVYGNLCLGACELDPGDKRHHCPVAGGDMEQCGPGHETTPLGDQCRDQCSKRNDQYFWCQRHNAPWDYCSPQLVFQQHLTCPSDSPRMTAPDPSSCPRYLSCEAGHIRLEECPQGLHYIHRNRTCEWPVEDSQCSDVFTRSDVTPPSSPTMSPSTTITSAPPTSTDPTFRIPQDYLDSDYYEDSWKPVRFPNSSDTTIIPIINPNRSGLQEPRINPSKNKFDDDNSSDSGFKATTDHSSTTTTEAPAREMDIAEIIEQSKDFKYGLTSHGELCTDECARRGYPYYWCHKASSNLGQWWDSDFCSPATDMTHYGKVCEDGCQQRGEKYFWCHRQEDGGWGYCSPRTVFTAQSCDNDNSQFYAIVGACNRYIQCRGRTPVVSSCESSLHFDYILQSCTFRKDARCIEKSDIQ